MLITDRQGNGQKRYLYGGTRPAVWDRKVVTNPVANRIQWNNQYSSQPVGRNCCGALIMAMKEGGISAKLLASGEIVAGINGTAQAASVLAGEGNVAVPSAYGLTMLVQAIAALTASGDLSAGINGRAGMAAVINVSQLTENDVAGVVLDAPIDGAYTLRQVLGILAAVAAGKTTITPGLPGEATVVFRNLPDTLDRVTADMTSSERANITLNP